VREWAPSPAARNRAERPAYLAGLAEGLEAGRPLAVDEREVLQVVLRSAPGVLRELERRRAVGEVVRVRASEPGISLRAAAEIVARRVGGSPRTIRWWAAEALPLAHEPGSAGGVT
jgi:hypothetical protein